ncbi:GNAT family N-acetyltransferase [Agarivorans sp. MS3-6]|uniref:GNAT family N-acetyltransferase n=1 Tax=Agarivorans sp. TSD2052 TaxID=2937286 RepID=UPI00200C9094|nr:GNAT family N-acetyltransferase [Agarivorans sp. TSD2052]UPW19022.1 GNAT family N-acetyltransferase [Agarivorans sp. TSD2052]
MQQGYYVGTDKAQLDVSLIHQVLVRSYWAKGISKGAVKTSIDNSLCFAAFNLNQQQVAFARVVSDYATVAYLADVFVLEEHQGKGLAKAMMHRIMAHPQLQDIRRFKLVCKDAQQLYRAFGFNPMSDPQIHMERG